MRTLPSSWNVTDLGTVVDVVRGVSYKKPDATNQTGPGLTPILRATNIGEKVTLDGELVFVPDRYVHPEQRLRPGDIIVATSSGSSAVVGKSALLDRPWNGAFGTFCCVIRAKEGVDPRYLSHYLQDRPVRERWSAAARGTNINNLKVSDIVSTPVPLAPFAEQRRIVAVIEEEFSRIDAGVEALHRVRRNLQRMRAAILEATVTGQLVPQNLDDEPAEVLLDRILEDGRLSPGAKRRNEPTLVNGNLPNLPQGWCWATLDQLAAPEPHAITDGPFGSNLKTSHYRQVGPRVIRLQNIGDGVFVDEHAHISPQHYEKLKKHAVAEGDLVIAALGEDLPRACVVPKWVTPAIVKADCIRFRPHRALDLRYLDMALNAPPTKARLAAIIHGVGRPRLNLTEIKSIQLPLPPAHEQRRIAVEGSLYFSIIQEVEDQARKMLARSEQLRQAVLAAAFDGDLVPQDPSDEPASLLLDRIKAVRAPRGTRDHLPHRRSRR
jgi:type I restriction enzyme S subunit